MDHTLDSRQIRLHVVLARTLNMSLAATELGLTPSGVSHCLKALEHDLGCRLFERRARGLHLTEAGAQFLEEAREIMGRMEAARELVRGWTDASTGRLRIAASGTACRFILAPALREFRESFPAYSIQLQSPSSPAVADLVLATDPSPDPAMEGVPIGEDDLLFFAHPLHPWVVQRKVDREDLAQRKLILPERGSSTFIRIQDYFREENIRLESFIEVADESALEELIRLDVGVGILPRWVAAEAVRRGHLVGLPLGRRRLKRHWTVVHRRARRLSLAENLLVGLCRSVLTELAPGPFSEG